MIEHYIYWISTVLLSLLYLASALMYICVIPLIANAQAELGYSASHLVPLMIVVKVLGPATILWRFNVALSDLAYVGMFYHLLLSASAHLGVHKPKGSIPAALGLILLTTSFVTQNAVREYPSPYAPPSAVVQTTLK